MVFSGGIVGGFGECELYKWEGVGKTFPCRGSHKDKGLELRSLLAASRINIITIINQLNINY